MPFFKVSFFCRYVYGLCVCASLPCMHVCVGHTCHSPHVKLTGLGVDLCSYLSESGSLVLCCLYLVSELLGSVLSLPLISLEEVLALQTCATSLLSFSKLWKFKFTSPSLLSKPFRYRNISLDHIPNFLILHLALSFTCVCIGNQMHGM